MDIAPPDPDQQSSIALLIAGASTSLKIPPMTLLAGSTYSFIGTISEYNWTGVTTVSVNTLPYPTTYIPEFYSRVLSWWKSDGRLIGCASCLTKQIDSQSLGCLKCISGLQEVDGECRCFQKFKYLELQDISQPYCRDKRRSIVSWKFIRSTSTVQFRMSFTSDFQKIEQNMWFVAQNIAIDFSNRWLRYNDLSIQIQGSSIFIEFTPTNRIRAGTKVSVNTSFIDEYNNLPFSPFYLGATSLTYVFPTDVYYVDNVTNKSVTTVSTVASDAMKIQSATSSVLPILAGGLATTALFLVDFVGDVINFRYINVPYPSMFMIFCNILDSTILPNPYSGLSNGTGVTSSSTGKFRDFGYSTVMLENSAATLNHLFS